jgi:release factor glutamine methyltransferase
MTVFERVAAARRQLHEAGLSSMESDLSARLLAEHVLDWSPERYFTSGHQPEPSEFTAAYHTLVARRASREPLPYIVGEQEFWALPFEVSPDVLIPRPETELIVEAVLDLFPDAGEPLTIADACTGCGCVAVALARERPAAQIIATDISELALAVARRNAAVHGVSDRVRFIHTDLLEGVNGPFDVVTANPPYVAERDRAGLQPEVGDHEPAVALFGGNDGLYLIQRITVQAAGRLRPGGYFIFEFGFGQDVEVEHMVAARPELALVELKRDLQGIARTVVAKRV